MKTKLFNIELMYFGDCPSWKETHQYLVEIIAEEEIGGIYEQLLELGIHIDGNTFKLENLRIERKSTGSFYTPSILIQIMTELSLKPLIQEKLAEAKTTDEQAKICCLFFRFPQNALLNNYAPPPLFLRRLLVFLRCAIDEISEKLFFRLCFFCRFYWLFPIVRKT